MDIYEQAVTKMAAVYPILDTYRIYHKLGSLDACIGGECEVRQPYLMAFITLNPAACNSPEEAYETCIHELFHVVCGPLNNYRDYAEGNGGHNDDVWTASLEPLVVTLTRGFIRAHGNPYQSQ
jgi:hypothetical protein